MRSLMVIHSEAISEWIAKGEVIDRYHNPGDLFDEVHLVLCNADQPPADALQRMAGRARVHVHNAPLPRRSLVRTLGWRPRLLRRWAGGIVEIAERVRPALVRCYGARHNALAASEIRRRLDIPYAVSLHINPEVDLRGRAAGLTARVQEEAARPLQRYGLQHADLVLPVYEPIVPFLRSIGVPRYEVAYNMLNTAARPKESYELGDPVELISVGRQADGKDPERLIRAVASMDGVRLTLIGDGPLHDRLRGVAAEVAAPGTIEFHRALTNEDVCARLAGADVFATHSNYWELSKAVLEAFLTGLPVLVNRRPGEPVPELTEDIAMFVEDDVEAWRAGIERLIADDAGRAALGRRAALHARMHWSPEVTEARFAEIYERLIDGARGSGSRAAVGST
jgi:glycosyltransferase involved in cell wall biosynthesis